MNRSIWRWRIHCRLVRSCWIFMNKRRGKETAERFHTAAVNDWGCFLENGRQNIPTCCRIAESKTTIGGLFSVHGTYAGASRSIDREETPFWGRVHGTEPGERKRKSSRRREEGRPHFQKTIFSPNGLPPGYRANFLVRGRGGIRSFHPRVSGCAPTVLGLLHPGPSPVPVRIL